MSRMTGSAVRSSLILSTPIALFYLMNSSRILQSACLLLRVVILPKVHGSSRVVKKKSAVT